MTFMDSYEVYLSFSNEGDVSHLMKDRHTKKTFQKTFTSSKIWTLYIYIVNNGDVEYKLLWPDSCDYEEFFSEI